MTVTLTHYAPPLACFDLALHALGAGISCSADGQSAGSSKPLCWQAGRWDEAWPQGREQASVFARFFAINLIQPGATLRGPGPLVCKRSGLDAHSPAQGPAYWRADACRAGCWPPCAKGRYQELKSRYQRSDSAVRHLDGSGNPAWRALYYLLSGFRGFCRSLSRIGYLAN